MARDPYLEFGDVVKSHVIYRRPDGDVVPGTTSISGQLSKPALVPWAVKMERQGLDYAAISHESQKVGTLAHEMVRCQFAGIEPDLDSYSPRHVELAQNALSKFLSYSRQNELEPLLVEKQLVSEEHRYGGTIDFFGKRAGKLAHVDWKTGSGVYREHYYQAAAYWNLLRENGYEADEVWIVRIGRDEDGDFEEHRVGYLEMRFEAFCNLLSFRETDGWLERAGSSGG